ncbi:MAG: M23 family metallopeptidase [Candidatus Liptonbacteria bacterium]|nr:M23 family metallopeptidase [Candidatus Liptonbacteria bacterium]
MRAAPLLVVVLVLSIAMILLARTFVPRSGEALQLPAAIAVTEVAPEAGLQGAEKEGSQRSVLEKSYVRFSSQSLEQGDTLVIAASPARKVQTGAVGATDVDFFELFQRGEWIGLYGVDAKMKPGTYGVRIAFEDGSAYRDEITVRTRSFPVSELALTPDLEARGYTPKNIVENIVEEENRIVRDAIAAITHAALFTRPFENPLVRMEIAGAYGTIRKSGSSELQHLGVDLDAPRGTHVMAVNDGAVRLARQFKNYGNTVVVDHGLGIYSLYLHLDSIGVEQGAKVLRGGVLGHVGDTGYALEPHLHFSVKIKDASVDPLRFIEQVSRGAELE